MEESKDKAKGKKPSRKVTLAAGLIIVLLIGAIVFVVSRQSQDFDIPIGTRLAIQAPAFPGAVGFGADSIGGREGQVIKVTNLNDSGSGSLRAAIDFNGPRIIVFDVAGEIEVNSTLKINDPFITIAGQSAPGKGVYLKNKITLGDPIIRISTNNVIIRHLRLYGEPSNPGSTLQDCLQITGGSDIIIDHSSFTWCTDEVFSSFSDSASATITDWTIQYTLVAEGPDDSTHGQGNHSRGVLIASDGAEDLTLYRNLFADSRQRQPKTNCTGIIDAVNNIMYNGQPELVPFLVRNEFGTCKVNIVKNLFKIGNGGNQTMVNVDDREGPGQIYVEGNIDPNRTNDNQDEDIVVKSDDRNYIVNNRFPAPSVPELSTNDAFDEVLDNVGATLPQRSSVDARIVNNVRNGNGGLIDSPNQVGGWPNIPSATAPADNDNDGMPNSWEDANGLNKNSDDSALDPDLDGYTNIEEYLNSTNPNSGEGFPTATAAPPTATLPPGTPTPTPTALPQCSIASSHLADLPAPIYLYDGHTEEMHMLYSTEPIASRVAGDVHPLNALHFTAIYWDGNQWKWREDDEQGGAIETFTAMAGDRILGVIDTQADESYSTSPAYEYPTTDNTFVHGIPFGYDVALTDLLVEENRAINRSGNQDEYLITATTIEWTCD